MTKVECPGPGFKGLKWKWIQDHAKEQQEREKEQVSAPVAQPPAPCHQLQPAQPAQVAAKAVADTGPSPTSRADGEVINPKGMPPGECKGSPLQQPTVVGTAVANAALRPAAASMKADVGCAPPAPGPTASVLAASAPNAARAEERISLKQEHVKKECIKQEHVKLEQDMKPLAHVSHAVVVSGIAATSAHAVPAPPPSSADVDGPAAHVGVAPTGGGPPATAAAGTAAGGGYAAAFIAAPSPILPATGLFRRKSLDTAVAVSASGPGPASSVVPVTAAASAPPSASPAPAPLPAHMLATTSSQPVVVTHVTSPSGSTAGVAPFTGPGQGATGHTAAPAAPQPSTTAAAGAQGGASAPAAVPLSATAPPLPLGAARVRLPPSRAASLNVAAAPSKDGDDFESMFTPLSSLQAAKAETPQAGALTSRSGSQVQASATAAAGQVGAAGAGADGAQLGAERKAPPKKASRLVEGRNTSSQPTAGDGADGDHVPAGRTRPTTVMMSASAATTTTGTGCTAAGGPMGKDTLAAAGAVAGKGHGPTGQPHQQPNAAHGGGQQHPSQRPPAVKTVGREGGKDAARGREPAPDMASPSGPPGGGAGAQTAAGGASARGAVGDRPAGQTGPSGAAGEVNDRKRPRSDGSRSKVVSPAAVDASSLPLDPGSFCMETLADRIKRAKRTTTSSSDQDGPHSHGGSAERPGAHPGGAGNHAGGGVCGFGYTVAAAAGGAGHAGTGAAGGDGAPPRPATSAEAQSRGAEQPPPPDSAPGAASGAGAGSGGPARHGSSLQPRPLGAQPHSRGPSSGRGDEGSGLPGTSSRGAGKDPDLPHGPGPKNVRVSGGGAVTDSSGGGAGAGGAQQAGSSGPPSAKAAVGTGAAAGVTGTKRTADLPGSRRPTGPPAKLPRYDPQLPRPQPAYGQDRKAAGGGEGPGAGAGAAVPGINGQTVTVGDAPHPPPCKAQAAHRSSSGPPGPTKADAPSSAGAADGHGGPSGGGRGPGAVPAAPGRPTGQGRQGEGAMPAAGSCKGPMAGSRGSKDGGADRVAYGPRGGAACGDGGRDGVGAAMAAGTTTTEPKTDSDTRTSRVVECFFEFDQGCRVGGASASLSGLGSSGSLQGAGGPGMGVRLHGGGRCMAGMGTGANGGGGLLRGGGGPGAVQHLDLGKIRSFKELWTYLAALYDGTLPDEMDSKIIYLDEEGDWIMVTPDEPWSSVAAAATKVLVTNRT